MKRIILAAAILVGMSNASQAQTVKAPVSNTKATVKQMPAPKQAVQQTKTMPTQAQKAKNEVGLANKQQAKPTATPSNRSTTTTTNTVVKKATMPNVTTAKGVVLKKDGTPDKRYKNAEHLKKDGTPDLRYKTRG